MIMRNGSYKKFLRYIILSSLIYLVMLSCIILSPSFIISEAQVSRDYVIVSLRSDLLTMNPFMQSLIDEFSVMELVYDTLYRQALNGSFIPWLPDQVEISENGTLWRFHIRGNVYWHDGKPLTAEDVEFTLNYTVKYRFPTRSNVWEPIERVWREGDNVYVKLKYPYAAFSAALASLFIVPKHIWENITDPMTFSNFDNPIGSGPFIWESRKAGDYVQLKANPNYWAGPPKIKGVIFKIYGSSDAAYTATVNGEIDAMNNLFIPPLLLSKALDQVKADPALRIHFRRPVYFQYLTFSLEKYPFSIKEFREAMLYAINVTDIVERVYLGYADPGSLGTLPPVFGDMPEKWYRPGLEKEKIYPFNLTKANEILDSLGFKRGPDGVRVTPNGTRLEYELLVSSIYPDRIRIAEMIRDWFAQVGIKINVATLDHRTVVSKLLNREFQMIIIGIWLSDPDDWFLLLHSSSAVKGGFNTADYKNPAVDKLLEEQRKTVDVETRRKILWELQEKVAQDIPYIPLVHIREGYLYRVDKVSGWQLSQLFQPANFWSFISLQYVTATPTVTTTPSPTPTTTPTPASPTQPFETPASPTTPSAQITTPPPELEFNVIVGTIVAIIVIIVVIAVIIFLRRKRT
jgi:peptide/nickel transport system substrate-binding protein